MQPRRSTIRFVLPAYFPIPIGGYRVVYQYANHLAGRGHDVSVTFPRFCTDAAAPRFVRSEVGTLLWAARLRLKHRPLVGWQAIHPAVRLRLVRDITDRNLPDADAVFATGWQTAGPVARLSPSKGRKFYLIQHHETWDGGEAEVNATWLLPMRKIVISRWLMDLGKRLGASDMLPVPNAIDHAVFRVTRPQGPRDGICAMYNTAPYKGTPALLDTLSQFHAINPAIRVRMFGIGPRGAEIPGWVEYHRNPDQRVLVEDIYNRSLVYLGASLTEGWALPPAEAMGCGCLFVGTDIGGVRDYAEHGTTALLSPVGDRAALLRNLCTGIADAGLRRRLAQAGTANIANFTWDAAGRMLEDDILRAVASPRRAARRWAWPRPMPAPQPVE